MIWLSAVGLASSQPHKFKLKNTDIAKIDLGSPANPFQNLIVCFAP